MALDLNFRALYYVLLSNLFQPQGRREGGPGGGDTKRQTALAYQFLSFNLVKIALERHLLILDEWKNFTFSFLGLLTFDFLDFFSDILNLFFEILFFSVGCF